MLQVFYMDVAKVDLAVAHVTMAIHVCCKSLFEMFCLFKTYVASVISGCCIYVAMTMLQVHVSIGFRRMLQLFYLNVANVDLYVGLSSTEES